MKGFILSWVENR